MAETFARPPIVLDSTGVLEDFRFLYGALLGSCKDGQGYSVVFNYSVWLCHAFGDLVHGLASKSDTVLDFEPDRCVFPRSF